MEKIFCINCKRSYEISIDETNPLIPINQCKKNTMIIMLYNYIIFYLKVKYSISSNIPNYLLEFISTIKFTHNEYDYTILEWLTENNIINYFKDLYEIIV